MATPPFDANSWEFLQRIIRINHNRSVRNYFKDAEGEDSVRTGRLALKTALTIKDNDSAIEVINKQVYFNNIKQQYNSNWIISYPEDYRVKIDKTRPQLVVIFKPTKRGKTNKQYPIHIPHYYKGKKPNIKAYYKGNFWAKAVLKDNSHIIVNGRSKTEAVNVVKQFLTQTNKKYRVGLDEIKTGEYLNKPFEVLKMIPHRADFYSQGKIKGYPDWQHYF